MSFFDISPLCFFLSEFLVAVFLWCFSWHQIKVLYKKPTPVDGQPIQKVFKEMSSKGTGCWVENQIGVDLNNTQSGRRNLAAYKLASLLGFNVIVPSEFGVDKKGKLGLVMDLAEGESGKDFFNDCVLSGKTYEELKSDPEYGGNPFLREKLTQLQLADILMGQGDRHFGNYFVQTQRQKNGEINIEIIGIDNDQSFGKLTKHPHQLVYAEDEYMQKRLAKFEKIARHEALVQKLMDAHFDEKYYIKKRIAQQIKHYNQHPRQSDKDSHSPRLPSAKDIAKRKEHYGYHGVWMPTVMDEKMVQVLKELKSKGIKELKILLSPEEYKATKKRLDAMIAHIHILEQRNAIIPATKKAWASKKVTQLMFNNWVTTQISTYTNYLARDIRMALDIQSVLTKD